MSKTSQLVAAMEGSLALSVANNFDLVNGMIEELGGTETVDGRMHPANVNMYVNALIARKLLSDT